CVFQAEDGMRDFHVPGVQTCALPICERYEMSPYGMALWHMGEALYPPGHPYRHSPIGSHEDLTNASLEDVRAFFRKYYVPSNAEIGRASCREGVYAAPVARAAPRESA